MEDTLIRRLQKDLPLTLQPPRIPRAEETAHPVSLEHPWGTYFLSCGIAGTRRGRIWSLWSGNEDGPCGCLMLARSDDEGRTWSPPQLVLEARRTPGGFPLSNKNGALWCDPEGGLWLFFSQSLGYFDGRSGVWAVRCADPDAETPEWGEPSRLWHGVPLNKPCVRRNGEWVLPLSLGIRRFASFDAPVKGRGRAHPCERCSTLFRGQTLPNGGADREYRAACPHAKIQANASEKSRKTSKIRE